jgi:hypothetical protein
LKCFNSPWNFLWYFSFSKNPYIRKKIFSLSFFKMLCFKKNLSLFPFLTILLSYKWFKITVSLDFNHFFHLFYNWLILNLWFRTLISARIFISMDNLFKHHFINLSVISIFSVSTHQNLKKFIFRKKIDFKSEIPHIIIQKLYFILSHKIESFSNYLKF